MRLVYVLGLVAIVGIVGAVGYRLVDMKMKPAPAPEPEPEPGPGPGPTPSKKKPSGGNNPPHLKDDDWDRARMNGMLHGIGYSGIDLDNLDKKVPATIVKRFQKDWNKIVTSIDDGTLTKPNGNFHGYLLEDGDPGQHTIDTFIIIQSAFQSGDIKGSWMDLVGKA